MNQQRSRRFLAAKHRLEEEAKAKAESADGAKQPAKVRTNTCATTWECGLTLVVAASSPSSTTT
jgi:5'-3' exonuclease